MSQDIHHRPRNLRSFHATRTRGVAIPTRRAGHSYDEDSQDPTYDPAIDNVYDPDDDGVAEDEDDDEEDEDENGDYEESPDAGYINFYEFMDEINEERRVREERQMDERNRGNRRRARSGSGRSTSAAPVSVENDVITMDDDDDVEVIVEPTPGPSNANTSHQRPSSQNAIQPSESGRQGSHEDDSSDDDVVLHVQRRKRSRMVESQDEEEDERPPPAAPPPVEDDDEDDVGCTICYEDFTTNGDHRLVSLKCGHFFGKSCIERWIRGEGRVAVCPTCKGKAQIKDVRVHFMKSVKMTDNSELVQLRVSNQEYRRKADSLEMDKQKLLKQIEILEILLNQKDARNKTAQPVMQPSTAVRAGTMGLFAGSKGELTTLNKTTSSKAFDFNGNYFAVGVSCSETGSVFAKYGIKKTWFEGNHLAKGHIMPLHANRSRVVIFSPFESDIVLSGGEDNMAAVHNMAGSSVRRIWHMPGEKQVWCGCWLSESRFAVGLNSGRVYEFDRTSNSQEPVRDITQGIGKTPIIFLAHDFNSSVVLVASMKKLIAFHGDRSFPFLSNDTDGFHQMRSVAWDPRTLHFCVSFRAAPGKTIIHRLYRLDVSDLPNVSFVEVNEWVTPHVKSTTLWNNCLFSTDDGIFSIIFSEDTRNLEVHDWTKGRPNVVLPFSQSESVCDIKVVGSVQGEKKIAVLTERHIYTATFKVRDN